MEIQVKRPKPLHQTNGHRFSLLALLIISLFISPSSEAHDFCQKVMVSKAYTKVHGNYWECAGDLRGVIANYKSCGDQVNLLHYLRKYPQVALEDTIVNYPFPLHPCEDKPGDTFFCKEHLKACKVTKAQFGPFVNACNAYLEQLLR